MINFDKLCEFELFRLRYKILQSLLSQLLPLDLFFLLPLLPLFFLSLFPHNSFYLCLSSISSHSLLMLKCMFSLLFKKLTHFNVLCSFLQH